MLKRIGSSFHYVSFDIEKKHINLQKEGVQIVEGVVGDAVHLPLRHGCVDIFVFHHAIDDILETRGSEGIRASIEEALRTLKAGGCVIFSHCIFSYDPYTLEMDLSDVQDFLQSKVKGRFRNIDGSRQRWLLVEEVQDTLEKQNLRRIIDVSYVKTKMVKDGHP